MVNIRDRVLVKFFKTSDPPQTTGFHHSQNIFYLIVFRLIAIKAPYVLKNNVLIMPFGNHSLWSNWIVNKENRDFDVKLLFYDKEIRVKNFFVNHESFDFFHLKNFKWWMIHNYLDKIEPEVLSLYDNFFFPDDDIRICKQDINQLFSIFSKCSLMMAQPALSQESYYSWDALRSKWYSGMRYVNTVELMCPLMSKVALVENIKYFCETKSGWGIDLLWGKVIRSKFGKKSIGVFDLIVVDHLKPVGAGKLYNKLEISPRTEMVNTIKKFQIKDKNIRTLNIPENRFYHLIFRKIKFSTL